MSSLYLYSNSSRSGSGNLLLSMSFENYIVYDIMKDIVEYGVCLCSAISFVLEGDVIVNIKYKITNSVRSSSRDSSSSTMTMPTWGNKSVADMVKLFFP